MDVRMPDGTIITNVPDNITQSELLARYGRMQGIAAPTTGTQNPLMGAVGRLSGLAASGVEAVAEVAERAGDFLESKVPLSNIPPEQIKSQKQLKPLFDLAGSLRDVEKNIGYSPSTKLSELADNPLNAVPFIAERVITSTPDMAAAVFAFLPYVGARTKEILDERVKNDNKTLDDATVGDVAAAAGAAVAEASIERFATKRLGKGAKAQTRTGRLAKETGIQGGTEAVEEGAAYLGETAGTIKGIDPKEMGERMLEGAIVGGGLGGGVQATREVLSGRKETQTPEKQEELQSLAQESAPERLAREQQIETLETAPEEAALAAFGERIERREEEPTAEPIKRAAEPTEELLAPLEEAPEIPETRPLEQPPAPKPVEIAELEREAEETERDLRRLERERGPSLATILRNRLSQEDVFDISPNKDVARVFGRPAKRGKGEVLADIIYNNELDAFLPPDLIISPTDDPVVSGEKQSAAEEIIKEKIRNKNYLSFETEMQLKNLGYTLTEIQQALEQELTNEQIRAEANAIAAEIAAEQGISPAETAPEIVTARDTGERPAKPAREEDLKFRQIAPPTPVTPEQQKILDDGLQRLTNAVSKYGEYVKTNPRGQNAINKISENIRVRLINAGFPNVTKREAGERVFQLLGEAQTRVRRQAAPSKIQPEFELVSETAEETVAREEKEAAERESKELKRIADLERDLFKLEQESNPVVPPVQAKLFDVTVATPSPVLDEDYVTPSFTREFDRASKMLDSGRINPDQFAGIVQEARRNAIEERRSRPIPARVRGADFIIEKLRNGVRRGLVTRETVDLTEWFIKQNPALVADLGLSIRNSEADGAAGEYMPTPRIAKLIAGSDKRDTAVHEILHHLERMMPDKIRNDITKSWARQYAAAKKAAQETEDQSLIKYFNSLDEHHKTGKMAPFEEALNLIKNGSVKYQNYQFANPSEFWAVNASKIMQGQYDVRGDRLGKLKKWLAELAQKIKDIFGMKSDAPIIRALDSLAKSDGKFVSTEMLASSGIYPNIRTNIFGAPPPDPKWGRPDDRKTDDVVYILQDKMIDTKRVVQKIQQAQGKLKDRWNAYLQEELYHGRTAKKVNDFLQDELSPFLKAVQRKGFQIAEVEEFLQNRHAKERNIQIAKVNPEMPDGGSGIFTKDAEDYLNALQPAKRKSLEELGDMVDAMTKSTRDILVDSGLETEDTIKTWEKTYEHYVPLQRAENDYEMRGGGMGIGKGFGVRGPASKRAVGSQREVVDILANIAAQRERAIVRAEKLRVNHAIYGLAVQHPNPQFWMAVDPEAIKDPAATQAQLAKMGIPPEDIQNLMKEPTVRQVDPDSGLVVDRINTAARRSEYVLPVRINGKDKFVFFNQKDPRALRMASALQNLDADQAARALSIIGKFTRYFARINTQYNPIFGIINFTRDLQGAVLNLSTTPIKDMTKQVVADTAPALRGIYADLRARRSGKKLPTGDWSRLWEEFQKEGGQTGFRDQFSRMEERAEALQKELDRLSAGTAKKAGRAILDFLTDYNETLENAIRLSVYKAALDKGISKQQAASIAKNISVNFNRKGIAGQQLNALYAFFNASVQGTARLYETLRGPMGKKIVAGGVLLGSLQAVMLAMAGFDEDEPPDFVKERNLIIPVGGKKYVTIPMPLGFNILPTTGRILTEWSLSGFKDTSKRVAQLTGATLEMFNPLGNAGWSFQTFMPTVADPFVAIGENKDWTGKPIAKEDISSLDPTPGYTRAKETASWFSKNLSKLLNYASGGTEFRPGKISLTPDQIDYLIGQITGGVGREAMKAEQTVRAFITGEELPTYKIPLFGRFFGSAEEQSAQRNRFYDNIKLLNEHENEIKGRRKSGQPIEEYVRENPEARLFGYANGVERTIQNLRKRREMLLEKNAPKEQIQEIEKRITEQMTRFNERIRQAKEANR